VVRLQHEAYLHLKRSPPLILIMNISNTSVFVFG
jgi:hypothetical protein